MKSLESRSRGSFILFHPRLLLIAAIVLCCAGCWEEVQYNPTEPAEVTSLLSVTQVDAGEVQPVANEVSSKTVELTAGELFETATETTSPTEEPSEHVKESTAESVDLREREPLTALPVSVSPQETRYPSAVSEKEISHASPPVATEISVLRPSRTALAAWRMSSRWSLAAAIYAKGQPEESYRDVLDQAAYAGNLVEVELPKFPTSDSSDLQSAVIGYLLQDASTQFTDQFGADYGSEYSALCELAIKTHALLLVYTPKSEQLEPVVVAIRQAAENSGLPRMYWNEVVGMLERRAPFADVKQKILAMHVEVGDYLSGGNGE